MYLDLLRSLNGSKCPLCHLISRRQSVSLKTHYSDSLSKTGKKCSNKIIFLWNVAWIRPSLQGMHRDRGSGGPSRWSESLFTFWNPGTWVYWRGHYVLVLPQKSSQASILWDVEKSVEKMQVDIRSQIAHWFTQFSLKDWHLIICVSYVNNISPSAL